MASGRVARQRLLDATKEYLLAHGLLDLTLTALAEGIGSNRRMLLYHFDSLELLVDEAVEQILVTDRLLSRRLQEIFDSDGPLASRIGRAWRIIVSPEQDPQLRIFFARLGMAVENPSHYERFFAENTGRWITMLAEALVADGRGHETRRRALAVVGLWSGLQISLLGGEDRADIEAAHDSAVTALLDSWQ